MAEYPTEGLTPAEVKAVQKLQEAMPGVADHERNQYIDQILEAHTPEEVTANAAFFVAEVLSNPLAAEDRLAGVANSPNVSSEVAAQMQPPQREEKQQWTPEELAELVAYGQPLTQDQQEQYDEYTENPQSETAQQIEAIVNWANSQNTIGSWTQEILMRPLKDADVLAIGKMMLEWDPKLNLMEKDPLLPNESDEDTLRRNTIGILNTANEFAQDIVNQWGADNEARLVDVRIDGNAYADVRSWADRFGTTVGRAGLAYKAAVDAGVDPELYGRLWVKNLKGKRRSGDFDGAVTPDAISGNDFMSIGDRALANKLKESTAKYGKSIAAVLAISDPELADKLTNDPWSLTLEELETVQETVGDVQEGDSRAFQIQIGWLEDRISGGFGGSTSTVDTASVKEHARALANDWNLPGLPDQVLAGIGAGWYGEARSRIQSSLPNPFARELADPTNTLEEGALDYDTFVKNHIRKLPEYQALFGNMMPGENEEDWVSRFESQSQGLLGDVDLEAVRAGMKSGSRDTVGQQAILSGTASTNSTFRERFAKMGEAFKDVT